MKETVEERIIDGVVYPAIYGNKEANDFLNNLIIRYTKKEKYTIYAKAMDCDVLEFTPCIIYVMKYDGRMKRFKHVKEYMTNFRVWFEFYVELAKCADEGVHWEYVQKGRCEILRYHGNVPSKKTV